MINNFGEMVSVTVIDFFEDGQTYSQCEEYEEYFGVPTGSAKGDLLYHLRYGKYYAPWLYERGYNIKDLISNDHLFGVK